MRLIVTAILIIILLSVVASAAGRTVTLTWQDTQNPTGTTYNVYKGVGDCATSNLAFVKINTAPVAALTYTESNVATGQYCYYVTAFGGGMESAPSNKAPALATPYAATVLVVVVQ
jgi:hypothetical protein